MTDPHQFVSINNIDAPDDIDNLLISLAKDFLSLEEIRAQRLSFVMGMLPHDCTMTREQVQELLDSHYG